jgi:rubrerythrin
MKWECTLCGESHRSNPEECGSCGHTVLKPDAKQSTSTGGSSSTNVAAWICANCRHEHNRKPFTCDHCGSNSIREKPTLDRTPPATMHRNSIIGTLLFWGLVSGVAAVTANYLFF